MTRLLVCLVAVSSVVVAQGPQPEGEILAPPVWFLRTGLTGTFSQRTAVCREEADKTQSSPTLILIPSEEPAEICINFPARTLSNGRKLTGGWRHDFGDKGACANGCCSFNPPTKNERVPVDHAPWFALTETETDCSKVPEKDLLLKAPFLFKGQNGDEKYLCVEEEGEYRQVVGQLSNCGLGGPPACCILYESA